ncbi:hypothetical protein P692DRAFT_20821645 [Suillus brevipes Sb2]|nr:hypothetical protein P692DRAFT_20821645 [Suillus brevipes Sb2]
MDEVLTGLRDIMGTSSPLGNKLPVILSILVKQAKEIEKRDQSIIIIQSKLDSQQAIMEQILSEQRQLISAVASLSKRNAQHASAALSPPVILETPEPKTPAAKAERSPSAFSVPELPSSQKTPTPACLPSHRNSIPVAHADLRAATADDQWNAPQHYMNTQRGGQLRRQGAFYRDPDWGTMTAISSAVPDSGAPPPSSPASLQTKEEVTSTAGKSRSGAPSPSSPASLQTKEGVTSTAGKSRADVRAPVEVEQETDAAVDAVKAAVSNKGDRASDDSSPNTCKRCRDPDEQEARKAANRMNISSIVHTAPDAPSKRRRIFRDIVESDAHPLRRSARLKRHV